jgi:uncharacterized membrane protein YidH (DUF202 family)
MQKHAMQLSALILGFLLPNVVFAGPNLPAVLGLTLNILQSLVVIVIGAALLVFLWGIVRFVISKDDAGKEDGRTYMLWGIIALFVMVSVWGLVFVLRGTLGLRGVDRPPAAPNVRYSSSVGGGVIQTTPVQAAVGRIMGVIAAAIPVLIALGVLFFIWGVFNYLRSENVDKKAAATVYITWGVVLLFVLVSVWGLVYMIGQTVGINTARGTTIEKKAGRMPIFNLIKR